MRFYSYFVHLRIEFFSYNLFHIDLLFFLFIELGGDID